MKVATCITATSEEGRTCRPFTRRWRSRPTRTPGGSIGDLIAVDRWIPGIAGRSCAFEDGRVRHEQISDYSPERRSYRYTIEDGPPTRDNRGRFAVDAPPVGSFVAWDSSFEPLDPAAEPQLTAMWRAAIPVVLDDLRLLCEAEAA